MILAAALTTSVGRFSGFALGDVLITDARIVDPTAETITRGAIVIEGERIARVLDTAPQGFDGEILDAGSGYVIPGLYSHSTERRACTFRF